MWKSDQETQSTWQTALALIAQRNEAALTVLYEQTSVFVNALAVKIVGNQADADEITLDVYVQVWSKAAGYDPSRGTPLGWLLMITRSRALDRLRARSQPSDQVNLRSLASPALDPESGHREREQTAFMAWLVGCLPINQQAIIDRAFFQDMSHKEVALSLKLPLGTVKTRMRLGLKRLRLLLQCEEADRVERIADRRAGKTTKVQA